MGIIFGSKELIKCLEKLGFVFESQRASHCKYKPPKGYPKDKSLRPFMIVQEDRGNYVQHSCSRYISEIKLMGFTQDEIEKAFKIKH